MSTCRELIDRNLGSVEVCTQMGQVFLARKDYARAAQCFGKVLELDGAFQPAADGLRKAQAAATSNKVFPAGVR